MARNKTPKCKHMMYAQKIDHLPAGDMDMLHTLIEDKIKPERYAMILHDEEVDAMGQPTTPDVHVMMSFQNARSIQAIAKILGDKPQYIQAWSRNEDNGYAYLIHATKKAQIENKHQYDPKKVIANFDYPSYVIQIQAKVAQCAKKKDLTAKNLLDALYCGVITKEEVEQRLTGSQLAYYQRQIDVVWMGFLKKQAKEWRKEMIAQGKRVNVIWIYGRAGTGKTSLARRYAEKSGQSYYISGSSRDMFQTYAGEHTIILDELRPRVIEYQDLLRILDPFSIYGGVMAPSRYSDKPLAADQIIVTSPYSPYRFYTAQFSDIGNKTDSFGQLARRIALTIQMQQGSIDLVKYDENTRGYAVEDTRPNLYSQQARQATQSSAVSLFDEVTGIEDQNAPKGPPLEKEDD